MCYCDLHSHPILNLLPAYTNDLDLEVAHLQEENAKLRRQQEKVKIKVMFLFCLYGFAELVFVAYQIKGIQ